MPPTGTGRHGSAVRKPGIRPPQLNADKCSGCGILEGVQKLPLGRSLQIAVAIGVLVLGSGCGASSSPHSSPSSPSSGVTSSTTSTTTPAAAVATCGPNQLSVSVAFNANQSELGAIKLSNTGNTACSLSGQPTITVLGDNGVPLSQTETTYHRAPDWPPPAAPIVLSASGALPQAIVELDWIWCGSMPHELEMQMRFSSWSSPLDIPGASISPSGFSPATCSSTGLAALFAVDYVRGFGPNGIIGPAS